MATSSAEPRIEHNHFRAERLHGLNRKTQRALGRTSRFHRTADGDN
jgi:hypothetical protein